MCGFTGVWGRGERSERLPEQVRAMAGQLSHRGPDDEGVWVDGDAGVALGHRRLSIVDLSAEGHQPMLSRSGRFVLAYNGEIYNYRELRSELMATGWNQWRGHSDTEVLLAAISQWGLEATLPKLNGMFAFAVWDRAERRLHLARDPLGEKPLYYGWSGGTLLFGSELKALRAHPAFAAEVDPAALQLYMRYGHVPAPFSMYRGIRKLSPGSWVTFISSTDEAEPVRYWSLREVVEQGGASRFSEPESVLTERLDGLLRDSVRLRMEADVPLGAFLSGGVDSSTVVALMQAQSQRPVQTFSIGFAEAGYNEAEHARAVAAHLGTQHTELYVTARDALAVVPRLPAMYDEPFADSSQIPTYLVAELARRTVTVSLSGDGGDELFGGYNRHLWGGAIWRRTRRVPPRARRWLARGITGVAPARWDSFMRAAEPLLPRALVHRHLGEKLHKLAGVLGSRDERDLYRRLLAQWEPEAVVGGAGGDMDDPALDHGWGAMPLAEQMMYLDAMQYLPDDILVKVDRATMAVSLEGRIPLLDPRVVEFAWRLPLSMKIREGQGKYLLRQVLYRYVPREMIERPKSGFAVPVDHWLRGPLRDWAEELLDDRRLRQEGLFDAARVRKRWTEHLSGDRNWQHHLWTVLMFQAWHESGSEAPVGGCVAAIT